MMVRSDRWMSRFGLVMAMAGNAVGLGNFLRFPGLAAKYGGGFMVPYFIALLLMGVPLMWMEWTIGRHGGGYGHGTTPGMMHRLWRHPISKYCGIFGVLLPAIVGLYYIYIESWTLGYAWQSVTGAYWGKETRAEMGEVFAGYLGTNGVTVPGLPFTLSFSPGMYFFFIITCVLNFLIFSRGISKGIEILARYAMPALLLMGIILAIRVLTLPPVEGRSMTAGLARIWVVDWNALKDAEVWVAAAGQVFFTLSVGLGMIHSYASYIGRNDDLTLNGLTSCSVNEFVEVILGGTIIIPAAAVFFSASEFQEIASKGSFADMGFMTFPVVFQKMAGGQFFGTLWFLLLFLAGMTSSVAMFTPLLLFLEEELRVNRRTAVTCICAGAFLLMQPVILFNHRGVLGELDYWAGTFFLLVFATLEIIIFVWIFGLDKGWKEMHVGAQFRVPRVFYYIMKYATPAYALFLVAWWIKDDFTSKLLMKGVSPEDLPYIILARLIILVVAGFLVWGVWYAWRTHPRFFEEVDPRLESAAPEESEGL